jgi:hypothetical protein
MRLIIVVFVCSLVFACSNNKPIPFKGPNGRKAYNIYCPNSNTYNCYAWADHLCPEGYDLLKPMKNNLPIECKEPKE